MVTNEGLQLLASAAFRAVMMAAGIGILIANTAIAGTMAGMIL